MDGEVIEVQIFPKLNEYLLKEWELRVCVLLSLFLQIFLIFVGTLKRSSRQWMTILLWLAYLLADIVAVFGLGLIVSRQSLYSKYCIEDRRYACYQDHIHIYWAPFLLVHLGGPDFITSFAPKDNELWRRHLFYLASQCITVAYCFYQSEQFSKQQWIPTLLVFLCGIIKCSERICALYYGSANSFRSSMRSLPDLNDNDGWKSWREEARLLFQTGVSQSFSHLLVLQYAFVYFTTFKGLLVDLILRINERNQSRVFFLLTSNKETIWIVDVELNYIYDVLFTKLPVLHHRFGYCSRTVSFISVIVSFALFHFVVNKEHFFWIDQVITYILLIGAIALDVIQFFMLLLCNWTVVKLWPLSNANPNQKSWKHTCCTWILFVKQTMDIFQDWLLSFFGGGDHPTFTTSRWAESLLTFNLIFYCLHRCSKGREYFYSYFGLTSFLNGIWYVKSQPLTEYLHDYIVDQLKSKSGMAESLDMAKHIYSSKGEWVLHESGLDDLLPFVENFNYDEILILWHIATELCYNDSQDQIYDLRIRNNAKQLSDYMLYLLVMKPDMMSAVSRVGDILCRNTCTEAGKLFDTKLPKLKKRMCGFFGRESKEEKEMLQIKACEAISSITREVEPVLLQENRYKLLLFNASQLAGKLKLLPSEKKWPTISNLWVELLSYAASHIRSSAHAQQLNKGGELITVVWLLMAHFGLGDLYEINKDLPEND